MRFFYLKTIYFELFSQTNSVSYFNYHAVAQNLIKTGHCKEAKIVSKHNNISPALILIFDNHKPMPIRFDKWFIYFELLEKYNVKITKKTTSNLHNQRF